MSGDKPRPTNPGWRQGPKPTQRVSTNKHGWNKEGKKPGAPRTPWSNKAKRILVAGVLLGVVATIIIVLLLIRPVRPPHLVLVGADNALNLKVPHNLAGKHSLDALEDWAHKRETGDKLTVQRVRLGVSEGKPVDLAANHAPWRRWLEECKGGMTSQASEKVALVLSIQGGADREGPYFVPQDADPADRTGWVRFKDLLAMFKELPNKTEKLLVLDVTQVQAWWPLGMLHNDFVRQLNALDEEIAKVPNLVVICASGEGQRSWVAGDGGPTVFGHFLVEGMRGAAGKDSNRISAERLFEYVRDEVKKWARDNRNELQEPIRLPKDDEGKARAEKMVLIVSDSNYKGNPPKDAAPALKEELRQVWDDQQNLLKTAPYVYKPHLWRQYLDTLLRYEQLLRAGDETSASRLATELSDLKRRMDAPNSLLAEGGRFKLGSSLAMPAALGMVPLKDQSSLAGKLNDLWDNPDATADDVRKLYDATDPAVAVQKRMQLVGVLLDRAADDPKNLLTEKKEDRQAVRWAPLLDTRGGPRPAEGHLLVMLPRHLAEQRDPKLVKQALVVRKLAEEAAVGLGLADKDSDALPAYSEYVFPRIQKLVEGADRKRRLGEDRAFAVQKDVWDQGKKDLKDAAKPYQEAQAVALDLRRVRHERNEMLALLHYYAQWMALRPEASESFDSVEKLWERLHEIDLLLDRDGPLLEKDLQVLKDKAKEAQERFQELRRDFERAYQALLTLEAIPRRWHETEAVLVVPFLEPRQRLQLLENSREIARQLNIKPSGSGTAPAPAAREGAVRQGRMAVAVVGQDRIDKVNAATEDRVKYETVRAWVEKPLREGKDWQESLLKAGEEIGHHWQRLPVRVRELTEQSLQNAKLEEAAKETRLAGRLVRHLDGAGAKDLVALDPLEEDRRLRLHDLLVWQALRAFRDHWFGDPGDKKPYFHDAGDRLLDEARSLAGEGRSDIEVKRDQKAKWLAGRTAVALALAGQLAKSGELAAKYLGEDGKYETGPANLVLTDENGIRRSYQFVMEGELPDDFEGLPVLHEDWKAGLTPAPERDRARRVLDLVTPQKRSQDRDYEFTLDAKKEGASHLKDVSAHEVEGVFRGQVFRVQTNIDLYRLPDLVSAQYYLKSGALAVQADPTILNRLKATKFALAIVLDSSSSMVQEKQANGKTRWDNALEALKQVLSEDIAAGVTVSVRVFDAKGTGEQPSRHIWPSEKWDRRKHLDSLMEKLAEVRPPMQGVATPLVKTTLEARDDFPRDFPGVKMVLVITDGGDFWYKSTQKLKKDLTDGFTNRKHLQLHAIGFDQNFNPGSDEAANSKQFRQTVEDLGGKHLDAKDVKALIRHMEDSLRLKTTYAVSPTGRPDNFRREEMTFGPNKRWIEGLAPGTYSLHMQLGERADTELLAVPGRVELRRGDSMLLNVRQDKNDFVFERDLWATRNATQVGDWWLDVRQNRLRDSDRSVEMVVSIERGLAVKADTGFLMQIKPGLVLFEVQPEKKVGEALPALRFEPLAGYPAPAWGLEVSKWDLGQKPILKSWWSDDDYAYGNNPAPDWARLLRHGDHYNANRSTKSPWAIGEGQPEDSIVVEAIRVERHKIKVRPDSPAREEPCLVVRIQHPPGRPYMVRLRDSGGQDAINRPTGGRLIYVHGEHRFYSAANRYTAIFPGYNEDRLRQERAQLELELVSVQAFKAKANRKEQSLAAPAHDSPRPQTVYKYD